MDSVFWPGLLALALLYIIFFIVGATPSLLRKTKAGLTELMLAGRSLPFSLGLATMTATWVGGGYINGTAEQTFSNGILWGMQAGVGYALSLILGGIFFAATMRRHGYSTLLDPFAQRFGRAPALIMMVPAVLGELFWSAAIMVALGSAFGVVIGIPLKVAILVSATIAILYTVLGGLRSVAYTDLLQLFLIFLGLAIAIPFIINNIGGLRGVQTLTTGSAGQPAALAPFSSPKESVSYGDWLIVLILGGIPWNVYFQRVLASRDARTAVHQSIWAGLLCGMMAIPPLIIGVCARGMDWSAYSLAADANAADLLAETPAMVLPLMLRFSVPTWVAVCGLSAIAAAVMSSVDSSILSASSMVTWNGYRGILRPEAGEREISVLMRVFIVLLGVFAIMIALSAASVAELWYLCGDIVFCLLFPQLALALFDPRANRTGALSGLTVSLILRAGGGVPALLIPAFIPYPDWSASGVEFPFRTLAMIAGLLISIIVSRMTQALDPPRPLKPCHD